jgi:DNA-binding transcriptional LysR family regulator
MPQEPSLTLRQIETIRAVMVAGSIGGAARLLNVAQPGVSRTMKHLESVLGMKLFVRRGGRYAPTREARDVFTQLQEVHKKINDLQFSLMQLERGGNVELSIGSVPSIAHAMVPRAVALLKKTYPDVRLNIELLKIEEAIDFLLLGRGELVCMSYRFDHPMIEFLPLAKGELVCLAHRDHPLAARQEVSAEEIVHHPLIGIDPNDPYGAIMASIFDRKKLRSEIVIRARFGTTVMQLVRENLGVAVLDSFTVDGLDREHDRLAVIPLRERPRFDTYIARRADAELSSYGSKFVALLRQVMRRPRSKFRGEI